MIKWRVILLLTIDIVLVNLGLLIALFLRFYDEGGIPSEYIDSYESIFWLAVIIYLVSFNMFKLYQRVWAYASTGELRAIISSVTLGTLGIIASSFLFKISLPRSVIILSWAFTIILIGGSRFAWRLYIDKKKINGISSGKKALIIGAGDAGVLVAREIINNKLIDLFPEAFIDDNPSKRNLSLMGIPVLGGREEIPQIVKKHNIDEIIIAMPSADGNTIRQIVEICRTTRSNIKVLPGVYELIDGSVTIDRLRPLQLEDLLGRKQINIDLDSIADYLKGRTVLITGAGGSIGSELCRQVAVFEPSRLVILGHGENSIHKIWCELKDSFPELDLEVEIADVRDYLRIKYIFKNHCPDVVFHAAAHKHLPLMEMHPFEAVKTNVMGTYNVARAAHIEKTKIFILVSTDKAVNPISIMGSTKLLAEVIVRQLNNESNTVFAAVRFGNVLGSNGSVVPIFQEQISKGGPVTITHPDMTRYFMTIPEAVSLVIQAGTIARGGEVFVLDMGEPVKILDLALDMIRLSGYEPWEDIDIIYTGVRPGEKLHEELMTVKEDSSFTSHEKIYVTSHCLINTALLKKELRNLENITPEFEGKMLFHILQRVIPDFKYVKEFNEHKGKREGVAKCFQLS